MEPGTRRTTIAARFLPATDDDKPLRPLTDVVLVRAK